MMKYRILLYACLFGQASCFEFPKLLSFAPPSSEPKASPQIMLQELEALINQAPKNGIETPLDIEVQIRDICQDLESVNPTKAPVKQSELMNGFWKMRWTNFSPSAPSSGKLGPFVGDVFQDVNIGGSNSKAKNILRIDFPPICGELVANADVVSDSTVAITFETVGNKLAGILPLGPKIEFETGKEVRLWEHIYLDDDYRILYARRQDEEVDRGFLYVMRRADDERFETGV